MAANRRDATALFESHHTFSDRDMMNDILKKYEIHEEQEKCEKYLLPGENENGEYSVFVELSRNPRLADHIKEITYGVRKLTGIDDFKFSYHKEQAVHEATEANLKAHIPPTAGAYDGMMTRIKVEGIKRFFGKTLMDDLTLDGDVITIHKPFDKKVQLRMIKEANTDTILEGSTDTISMDEESMSEIFWLTKVLGNYNINKVGENFMFDNKGQAMLLQRIQ
jgi:hypothetical protein